jgi:hypothetical protein
MDETPFDLREPGVLEAISDDDAMRCWQRLRMRGTPQAVAVVAEEIGIDLPRAHAAMDLLEGAKMARKLWAGRGRRVVTYEVTTTAIVIIARSDDEPSR